MRIESISLDRNDGGKIRLRCDDNTLELFNAQGAIDKVIPMDHPVSIDEMVQIYHRYYNLEYCVCCGDEIPEGRQLCPRCEKR